MTRPAPSARVGIVGLGLIGGSIAYGLRTAWPKTTVVGVDAPDVLERARTAGAIHEAAESVDGLRGVELVVLATPIARIVDVCSEVAALGSEVIVTDVGSTKREIVRAGERRAMPLFDKRSGNGFAHSSNVPQTDTEIGCAVTFQCAWPIGFGDVDRFDL